MDMISKGKNQNLIPFVIFLSFIGSSSGQVDDIHVGVILDLGSLEGKILQSCISMAISDFYGVHGYYETKVILHTRDSKGEHLQALSSALDLLKTFKLRAIMGAQTSMEAKFLAELGDKTKLPVISFASPTTSPTSNKYGYLVQLTQDKASQAAAIAAIVDAFQWKNVVIMQEDSDDWSDLTPHLVESLQEKSIHIAYKTSLAALTKDDKIIEELQKLMELQQMVFIVHLSPSLASRLFMYARKFGMMSEGYAWIMTVNSMNLLHSMGSSVTDSMQGAVGLKSYIPASKELHNFTSRWRKKFLAEANVEAVEISPFCVSAYDVAWSLAVAAERARPKTLNIPTSTYGSVLVKEILRHKFKGLGGEFDITNMKLVSNAFEVVNVVGRGERRVGFWTSDGNITREIHSSNHGRLLSSNTRNNLEDVIWPGGSATIPKGSVMQLNITKKLKIGVPRNPGFPELVNVVRDPVTNVTTATGFCIDVFKAAIEALDDQVEYEFIPSLNASGPYSGTYSKLIDQIYFENYDAAVGDITITANRSLYVDFTVPYTDLGVGMIAPKDSKNMWIFLRPLTSDLWLSSACFFILTGTAIWLIERRINDEFQGPISYQIGMIFWFAFSTLVFAHRERLVSNWSKFVLIVWLFVVLILTSSYTATLTSMITVQQINIQLNSKENFIGYQTDSFTHGVISNLNFKNTNLKPFTSPQEYANALSRGSKKGGVSAIIDEIPYIKIFLARYSADYSMTGSMSTTSGLGFAFRRGSPLVANMSRAIVKLREEGKLKKMEDAWFKSQSSFTSGDDSDEVKPLTVDSFRGLFLVTGLTSALALAVLYGFVIYRNWHIVQDLGDIIREKLTLVKEYLSAKVQLFRT